MLPAKNIQYEKKLQQNQASPGKKKKKNQGETGLCQFVQILLGRGP